MNVVRFADVVEAADQLSAEEKQTLLEVLQHRVREARRAVLLKEIDSVQAEFDRGQCRTATPDELMREIQS